MKLGIDELALTRGEILSAPGRNADTADTRTAFIVTASATGEAEQDERKGRDETRM